ncbi:MAG: hypothetical protein ACOYU7_05750 [Bacillota bacterium]
MSKRLCYMLVVIGIVLIGSGVYATSDTVQTFLATDAVKRNTYVVQEEVFVCNDTRIVHRGPAPLELVGLSTADLLKQYRSENGWALTADLPYKLVVRHKVQGFCPTHASYRHLGDSEGFVAVYEGPLGYDQHLLTVTRILVEQLPPGMRENLARAQRFKDLDEGARAEVRRALEFTDENSLNAVLENMDELQD